MSVFAIGMVRDEMDIVEGWIRHLADEVDEIIIADNGSVDGTRELLRELRREHPLTVYHDDDPAYYQAQKMTRLATIAGEAGATWIIPADADEIWINRGDRIRKALRETTGNVARVPLFNHFPTAIDAAGSDPFRSIGWRQASPGALPKVAYRWHAEAQVHQGNHGVTHPDPTPASVDSLEIRHFPYRSEEQFVRKAVNGAAAYRCTDLPPDIGAHWRAYGDLHDRLGRDALVEVFRTHFWFLSPTDSGLVFDPAPYCRWR